MPFLYSPSTLLEQVSAQVCTKARGTEEHKQLQHSPASLLKPVDTGRQGTVLLHTEASGIYSQGIFPLLG